MLYATYFATYNDRFNFIISRIRSVGARYCVAVGVKVCLAASTDSGCDRQYPYYSPTI